MNNCKWFFPWISHPPCLFSSPHAIYMKLLPQSKTAGHNADSWLIWLIPLFLLVVMVTQLYPIRLHQAICCIAHAKQFSNSISLKILSFEHQFEKRGSQGKLHRVCVNKKRLYVEERKVFRLCSLKFCLRDGTQPFLLL